MCVIKLKRKQQHTSLCSLHKLTLIDHRWQKNAREDHHLNSSSYNETKTLEGAKQSHIFETNPCSEYTVCEMEIESE